MAGRAGAVVGAAALVGISLSLGLAFAGQPGQKSIHDGVFTADQVEAGERLYAGVCSECHSKDTFGPDYMVGWTGASVGELFEQLQATMPYESPGALEDTQYVDVLAYIFKVNGVEAGDLEMSSDVEELRGISIEGPFTWNGNGR